MRRIDKQVKYQMDFEQLNFEIKERIYYDRRRKESTLAGHS